MIFAPKHRYFEDVKCPKVLYSEPSLTLWHESKFSHCDEEGVTFLLHFMFLCYRFLQIWLQSFSRYIILYGLDLFSGILNTPRSLHLCFGWLSKFFHCVLGALQFISNLWLYCHINAVSLVCFYILRCRVYNLIYSNYTAYEYTAIIMVCLKIMHSLESTNKCMVSV